MKNLFCALALPILVHVAVILILNYDGEGVFSTAEGFSQAALLVTLFWGVLVLVPASLVQIGCAYSLARSGSRQVERFLIGVLNPSIALLLVVAGGWLVSFR